MGLGSLATFLNFRLSLDKSKGLQLSDQNTARIITNSIIACLRMQCELKLLR